MLKTGILNPQLNALLARVRHTNCLVIADRGFPFWPALETIDLSLVDGIPTIAQVLTAILPNFQVGPAWMALEFKRQATEQGAIQLLSVLERETVTVTFEPHIDLKRRVPSAIGVIRTADTIPYGNIILESA